jgi:hypothetical protein
MNLEPTHFISDHSEKRPVLWIIRRGRHYALVLLPYLVLCEDKGLRPSSDRLGEWRSRVAVVTIVNAGVNQEAKA